MPCGTIKRPKNTVVFNVESGQPAAATGNSGLETGLYYYGARYLDPKTSRWISGDPAMGEYIPQAPINDKAKKHNKNLPGMGGIFNVVNMHTYHYAWNNPIKLTDPDGKYFYNFTKKDIIVVLENGEGVLVHPGYMYKGAFDGAILTHDDDTMIKITGLDGIMGKLLGSVDVSMESTGDQDTAFVIGFRQNILNSAGDIGKKVFAPDKLLSGVYKCGSKHYDELAKSWVEAKDLTGDKTNVRKITRMDTFFVGTRQHHELIERV